MFKKNISFGFDLNWGLLPQDEHFVKAMRFVHSLNIDLSKHAIVNGLPVFFDPAQKKIAITFSGGADSTMLTYILCRLIEEHQCDTEIVAITLIRFWETRSGTEDSARNVFSIIDKMFPRIKKTHMLGFVPTAMEFTPLKNIVFPQRKPNTMPEFTDYIINTANADVYAVKNYTDYVTSRHGILKTYSGTTMNPSHLLEDDHAPAFRKLREFTQADALSYSTMGRHKDPFGIIQKSWVMAQYENFGIPELRDATRSCESTDIMLNAKFGYGNWTITDSRYSCGSCFFCKERQWGTDNMYIFLESYHK